MALDFLPPAPPQAGWGLRHVGPDPVLSDSRTLSPKPFSFCPALPNVKPAVSPTLPKGVSEPLPGATKDRATFYPPRAGLGTATWQASSPPASSRGRAPSKPISPLLPGPEEVYNHRRPPRPGVADQATGAALRCLPPAGALTGAGPVCKAEGMTGHELQHSKPSSQEKGPGLVLGMLAGSGHSAQSGRETAPGSVTLTRGGGSVEAGEASLSSTLQNPRYENPPSSHQLGEMTSLLSPHGEGAHRALSSGS